MGIVDRGYMVRALAIASGMIFSFYMGIRKCPILNEYLP